MKEQVFNLIFQSWISLLKTYFGKFPLLGSCHLKTKKIPTSLKIILRVKKSPSQLGGGLEKMKEQVFSKPIFASSPLWAPHTLKQKNLQPSSKFFFETLKKSSSVQVGRGHHEIIDDQQLVGVYLWCYTRKRAFVVFLIYSRWLHYLYRHQLGYHIAQSLHWYYSIY